jgi:sugar/nucleoside kinase (ribokinase family)
VATQRFDVVGIGNAIVDVIASAEDDFLERFGMTKGSMMLIDETQAEAIYEAMGPAMIVSGGSAANTIAGIASLGGTPAYIGKVRNDDLGHAFRHDIVAAGAHFVTPAAEAGATTARCLILVTPDSERTMNTFLGASVALSVDDIDADLIASSSITYLEGYLYDQPAAQAAFHEAARIAHAAGQRVALSLSDSFCVRRHRQAFLELIDRHVDILFCNEGEVVELYETDRWESAVERLRRAAGIVAVTRGAAGSVAISAGELVEIDAAEVLQVVDTTGAGDLYAAGFLFGLTRGASLEESGRLASIVAGEIVSHFGARPQADLDSLIPHDVGTLTRRT